MALATAAVWRHTVDEIRIGELSAIPARILNLGMIAGWGRLTARWRGWTSLLFGLFLDGDGDSLHVVPLRREYSRGRTSVGCYGSLGAWRWRGAKILRYDRSLEA